jgi:hypothetical protein
MSHFCQTHPRYEAKREPNSLCGECWTLWFYRCPERKDFMVEHIDWMKKNLPTALRKPNGTAATERNG